MVSEENLEGFMAVVAGMVIFKATTYLGFFENSIQSYPYVVIILGLIMFFYRKKIAKTILFRG